MARRDVAMQEGRRKVGTVVDESGTVKQVRKGEDGTTRPGNGNAGELRCATDSHVSEGWVAE